MKGTGDQIKETMGRMFDWKNVPTLKKHIYQFNEGSRDDTDLLGNKGAKLCDLVRLGLPVPPGFVISTQSCLEYFKRGIMSPSLMEDVAKYVRTIEKTTSRSYTTKPKSTYEFPLLLSVRSGAAVSMPGMMQTILNVGLNDNRVLELANASSNPRFAYDCYRRFLQMFGEVVLGIDRHKYENVLEKVKTEKSYKSDKEFQFEDLKAITDAFKDTTPIPYDPTEQLHMAIESVFKSWLAPRAVKYRDIHGISDDLGTAVTVQAMVYGNINELSGSGVAFTRNPSTGVKEFYGEYLPNSEGEDVVSGARTPEKLSYLRDNLKPAFQILVNGMELLENHYKDVQDIEFTVETGTLFFLQTRNAKRSAQAAVTFAVDMVREGMITERQAIMRMDVKQMSFFVQKNIDPQYSNTENEMVQEYFFGQGLASSAGAAVGKLVFENKDAEKLKAVGDSCILCREDTSADDIAGMYAAVGVITIRGGFTSHAAIVMRGMGKSAVTAADVILDAEKKQLIGKNGMVVDEGDTLTIDGSTGLIYKGEVPLIEAAENAHFNTILRWANKYKRLGVLVNADQADEVEKALILGAEGLGLARTEHMFFNSDRIQLFRHLILSDSEEERRQCLQQIEPLQRQDFVNMFRLMDKRQVTIRLLDPPLHEFLPKPSAVDFNHQVQELAKTTKLSEDVILPRIFKMQEVNPMLGFRGIRIAIAHPQIAEMQVRSIINAAIQVKREDIRPGVQIMLPVIISDHEIDCLLPMIKRIKEELCGEADLPVAALCLQVGVMMETPRACIRADRIARLEGVDFMSFGTNDLTQMVFGLSRDDSGQFMPKYLENHIIAHDPFVQLDVNGVGAMIHTAIKRARHASPDIKIGVCGEHGSDPESIRFFAEQRMDYVSVSLLKVPGAKVAAAQAYIQSTSTAYFITPEMMKLPTFGVYL